MAIWTLPMSSNKQPVVRPSDGEELRRPPTSTLQLERLLTIGEVATITGLKVGSIYHLVSAKRVPVVRLSRRCIRFRLSDLIAWFDQKSELPRDAQR
jgi:excisionase family DNA binding protein